MITRKRSKVFASLAAGATLLVTLGYQPAVYASDKAADLTIRCLLSKPVAKHICM